MGQDDQRQTGPILLILGLACVAALVAWGAQTAIGEPSSVRHQGPQRVVSLSPAITETLFAIGAGDQLVGVSEFTQFPPGAARLPHAGTAITPDLERLIRVRPTLIVAQDTSVSRLDQLRAIAETRFLAWRSVDDMVDGTRVLGRLTGHRREAETLARRLASTLERRACPTAPRVLLLLGYSGGGSQQLWFVKRNSIHGRALGAAGVRNAIAEDVQGPPTLSIERLLIIDPEIIIVLSSGDGKPTLDSLRKLTHLQAVAHDRLGLLSDPAALIPGPRILELVDALRTLVQSLEARS